MIRPAAVAFALSLALTAGCARDEVSLGASAPCAAASARCQTRAGGACVDLQRSMEHCGACGRSCPDAGVCRRGQCCPNACLGRCIGARSKAIAVAVGFESAGQHMVDIDRDGYDDAVSVNQLSRDMTVVWGNPSGGTELRDTWPVLRVNGDFAFGDLDADGDTDLVATVQTNGPPTALHVGVYLGEGGREPPRSPVLLREPGNPDELVLGDFDGDGRLDLITRRQATGCLSLRVGDGRGGFAEGRCVATVAVGGGLPGGTAVPLLALDLDGDRRAELLTRQGRSLGLLRFGAGGTATGPREIYRFDPLHYETLAGFDLDGDGRPELGVGYQEPSSRRMDWFSLDREGRVTPRCASPWGVDVPNRFGDFDGDGIPDGVSHRSCAGCRDSLVIDLRGR